jgi:hypothetical protein
LPRPGRSGHELETQALSAQQLGFLREDAARNLEVLTIENGKDAERSDQFDAAKGRRPTIEACRLKTGD